MVRRGTRGIPRLPESRLELRGDNVTFRRTQESLNRAAFIVSGEAIQSISDNVLFFNNIEADMRQLVSMWTDGGPSCRLSTTLACEMVKHDDKGQEIKRETIPFRARMQIITTGMDVVGLVNRVNFDIAKALVNFIKVGSGWSLSKIMFIEFTVSVFNPYLTRGHSTT